MRSSWKRWPKRWLQLILQLTAFLSPLGAVALDAAALQKRVAAIDSVTPGRMGVYLKDLRTGQELKYEAGRSWYLASTTKIPVAIAVLQLVEAGELSLDDQHVLQSSDYVDGSGGLLSREPGTRVSVRDLLQGMLVQSDSTAADILIRRVGEERLNRLIREKMGAQRFGPLTTLLRVRSDAYAELHPRAAELGSQDFIAFKKARDLRLRLQAFERRLGLRHEELKAKSIEQAFDRYYQRGLNSAPLEDFGFLLARLARGELLKEDSTRLLLDHMAKIETGNKRIKAGLPRDVKFAQKTGTQIRRMCNVGLLTNAPGGIAPSWAEGMVLVACLEDFDRPEQGEKALRDLGTAIGRAVSRPTP